MIKLSYEIKIMFFVIVLGGLILILSLSLNTKINKFERLKNTEISIKKLHISMLMLRRYEKDFLLRKNHIYKDKHQKEVIVIKKLSQEIINNLNENDIDSTQVKNFVAFVDLYKKSFHKLVEKYFDMGLNKDLGLYGSLRKSVHKVENEALKSKNKELLVSIYDLRKQEKDFMLRNDTKYVDNFEKIMNNLYEKSLIDTNLKKYHKDFLSLVNLQKEIGLSANLGLRGEMRDNVHKSEELIIETVKTLDKHISLKIDDLTKNIFLMSFFIFSLFGLSMFLISKRNMHKLQVLTNTLNDVNNNLEKRIKTEIQQSKLKDKLALEEAYKAQNTLNKSLKIFSTNVIASETDTKGIITFVSEALCKISGYKADELIGQPHNILRHPETKKLFFKEMWENLKEEKSWEGELKNKKKDGGFYWVRTTIYPRYDSDNKLIGFSSVRHDITPERVKEEFLANMSHELRTPLNSIIGFSNILQKKLKIIENKELLSLIRDSSKHLLTLINDILDLSKMNSSEFNIEKYEFNAYKEIIRFAKRFDNYSNKKLTFVIKITDNLKAIFFGDWLRISQIILNLMSNSVKFTGHGGRVHFKTDYIDESIVLIIEDNGIGMNTTVQDKIFKPFVQADGSTTRVYGGTGLGLSITQKLVKSMNGKIELQSEEGIGTIFKVTIPLEKISDTIDIEEELDIEVREVVSLSGHVLVVEDNKTNQILINMLLEDFGITCDIANDGLEAIEMYDPQKHKLILMDENMPNMNGLDAMKEIRKKYKDKCTPIIALTANTMAGDEEYFLSEGMDNYLSKPIDDEQLYKILKLFI